MSKVRVSGGGSVWKVLGIMYEGFRRGRLSVGDVVIGLLMLYVGLKTIRGAPDEVVSR